MREDGFIVNRGVEESRLKKNVRTDWQIVGTVGVDAGLMYLGDPCYLGDNEFNYSEFIDDPIFKKVYSKGAANYNGHTGVVCTTGYGDGSYNVFVKKYGNRVAEMKIVFIEEGEEVDF